MEKIKIDEDGRYLLLIEGERLPMGQVKRMETILKDWWENGDKFFILDIQPGVKVRLERMEEIV